MRRALIGHTGFVGSNIMAAGSFTHFYNTSNFNEMAGESFDEVVCAGISAVKWLANKDPVSDWQGILALLDVLNRVKAEKFTLISTIDVYPDPSQPQDENSLLSPEEGQPYGRHRLAVERFIGERFNNVLVARLPALFGKGLKKNIIFDLLTENQTEKINPQATFQWYPLDRLTDDLTTAWRAGITLVNLFPEPLTSMRILTELFPNVTVAPATTPAPLYNLRTSHADTFGGEGGFIMPSDAVMASLKTFVAAARNAPKEMLGK